MEIDIILDEFSSAQRTLELGLMAEEYGFRGLWTMNYGDSRDAFLVLAPLADRSSTLKLGAMAISPHEMHPLKTANLLFTLNEMSNGRAMLMAGAGGAVRMTIEKGDERVFPQVREYLEILKGASPDKALNYKGEVFRTLEYKPEYATDTPPLIYFGSNQPRTRRMTVELADGLITSDFTVPMMKGFFEDLDADLKAVGRARDDIRISNFQAWHIRADAEASMREARRELITRGWLFPHHLPFLDADEIKFVGEHFMDFLNAFINRTHVIKNVPDELINKMISNFAVAGGLDQIDHAIEVYKGFADSGLDEICIRVHGDQAEQIRLIGEHIMPAFR